VRSPRSVFPNDRAGIELFPRLRHGCQCGKREKRIVLVFDGCQSRKRERREPLLIETFRRLQRLSTVVDAAERDDAGEGRERDRGANRVSGPTIEMSIDPTSAFGLRSELVLSTIRCVRGSRSQTLHFSHSVVSFRLPRHSHVPIWKSECEKSQIIERLEPRLHIPNIRHSLWDFPNVRLSPCGTF
jgi:hypothetical protein